MYLKIAKIIRPLFILAAVASIPAPAWATPYTSYTLVVTEHNPVMADGKTVYGWGIMDVSSTTAGSITLPNGTTVSIPGTADHNAPAGGSIGLPGPALEFQEGQPMNVTIVNGLNIIWQQPPVSLIIPGLFSTTARPAPVMDPTPPNMQLPTNRVRSFTPEVGGTTVTGNPPYRTYSFTAKAGTYLYESSTYQQQQVPMGFYGSVIVRPVGYNATTNKIAYAGPAAASNYAFYSENPPLVLADHDPGQNNTMFLTPFGPLSTILYTPKYYTMNGKGYPYTDDLLATVGQPVLVRLLNAGSRDYYMTFAGQTLKIIAEDGIPKKLPVTASAVSLPAGKTVDAIMTSPTVGYFPVFDRALNMVNGQVYKDVPLGPSGMMTFLGVFPAGGNCSPAKGKYTPSPIGPVTITDALHALREAVGLEAVNVNLDVSPVDVATGLPCGKGNGTIGVTDALFILQKAVGANPY